MDHLRMQLIESVLSGGGVMGARMRAVDWSTTALGPLEQWPQSLRICVRIILGSGYPMVIYWGPEYTMLYNDACRQVMGTKHPAALAHGFREVFPEVWDSVGPLFDRVMTDGQHYSTLTDQQFLLNRNNYLEECYFAVSFSPIPDDTGEVGGVLGTSLETTERVIEDRRRQVLRDVASRTVEARHEDEVWRVSTVTLGEHRLTIPFAVLYACRPSDRNAYLLGPSIGPDGLCPSVIDCTRQNLWGFAPALTSDGVVVDLGHHASGLPSIDWPVPVAKAAVVPIRLREKSDVAGFLVLGIHPGRAFDDAYRHFVRRIAEQIAIGLASARAYEQERQRADALAELDRSKTAFFSNVSHEFRTPLQLMLGPLEEVLPEAVERLGPDRHQQLLTVRRNALRLHKLVDTLLDFSRLEARRLQAVYEPTDLAGLTSDIASAFRSAMEGAGLRLSVDCHPTGEPVFVDRGMWEKIVLNLLSNAFKFTFEGEVAISLRPVNAVVELQVRDTGVGIPDDQCEKVFERFHRVERTSARTHEGTGIGLALVQELVRLHGGSVGVKSAVGVGSTFTVTIPRGKEHLPAESIQPEQSLASTEIPAEAYVEEALRCLPDPSSAPVDVATHAKLTSLGSSPEAALGAQRELIVLADDNADMRAYLARLLGDRYEVLTVADGHQALEAARQLRPALVLADVMMPLLDGFGLLRAIRGDTALCSTPVILVSARAAEESRVEGLQADADDYLVKPFTSQELLARVATHVKMANLRRVTAEREERLRNEQSSERNLSLTMNTIPTFIQVSRPDGTVLSVNQAVLDYHGVTLQDVQKEDFRSRVYHPDDVERLGEERKEALKRPLQFEYEQRALGKDGKYRWFLVRYNPLLDDQGRIDRWYATAFDIDDRKRTEFLRAAEMQTLQLITDGASLQDILNHLCSSIDQQVSPWVTSIHLMDADGTRLWPAAGSKVPENWIRAITPLPVAADTGMCGTAAFLKKRVIVPDVATESTLREEYRGLALQNAIRAGWSHPILTKDDHVLGTLAVYSGEARVPTSADLAVIEAAARIALIAIEHQRSQEDLRRALDEIQQSESKLRQVIDAIPALAWCNLPDGPNEFLNRGWHEYTGLSAAESHGWGWQAAFHPEDLPSLMDKWLRMLVTGESGDIEARLRRHDGVYRWFLIRAEPFRDESGKIVRWYGTSTDIDDRKRAEAEVERAYLHLADAQRLSKTGSSIWDVEKDDHLWSDELYRICEFEPGSPITTQRLRDILHPEDIPVCEAALRRAMAGADLDLHCRIVTSRGVVKHLRALAHRIAHRPVFVGAVQDVTESTTAAEALSRARSELAHMARVTTLSALTASIGHEVNQPIAAVITSADACLRWLTRDQPDLDRARAAVTRIQEDGKRAAEVIRHLKSFYRKDVSPQREQVSANDVVRGMLVLLRNEADRHSVVMRVELAANLPSVSADRVQLQQVLMNLMLNGIEAMGERGGELTISSRGEGGGVMVSVSDTGVGIPADELENIFNAFVTTKAGGTGMGLAISRTIVESHGGRLWAAANPEGGATFHFTLPTGAET